MDLSSLLFPPPLSSFTFEVYLADLTLGMGAQFSEVSGLTAHASVDDSFFDDEMHTANLYDKITYDNLVLKRGLTASLDPFTIWCQQVFSELIKENAGAIGHPELGSGKMAKMASSALSATTSVVKNLTVSLLNANRIPVLTWIIYNAIPIKWEVSPFNAMESKVAIETIELKYRKFEVVPLPIPTF